jgi:hypothetical protein
MFEKLAHVWSYDRGDGVRDGRYRRRVTQASHEDGDVEIERRARCGICDVHKHGRKPVDTA